MRLATILKAIALICYAFIFWNGQMISIPMFFYLPATAFSFDFSLQQISALFGIAGLFIMIVTSFRTNDKKKLLIAILIFILLLLPIIQRLIAVPLYLFNYAMFIIPVSLFATFYLLFLVSFYISAKKLPLNSTN